MTGCLVDVVAAMGDVFSFVYNFHVPLALKVGCPSNVVGCDIALVFIFLPLPGSYTSNRMQTPKIKVGTQLVLDPAIFHLNRS
jgi:hypothetical protein